MKRNKPTIHKDADAQATGLAPNDGTKNANGTLKPERRPPVPFTEEIGATICEHLRNGETLRSICKLDGMPTEAAVRLWASEDTPFATQYARARTRLSEDGR